MRSHFLNKSPAKIPHKTIICATLQFLIGTTLIVTGCLLLTGYMKHVGTSRAIAVLIVGILVFVPGCYHLVIIYRTCRGCQDYSYSDLPDCED
ncbi:transmembrane protein 230-like [Phodopus roborovskii]|uniref:transmembrane protein 230-like n=1 Tax=Phodopus roborovskii TaxID=109678 RepID=UPI0021E4B83D|nr:transmembrane protein 230-like [Phodopus roborovskii]